MIATITIMDASEAEQNSGSPRSRLFYLAAGLSISALIAWAAYALLWSKDAADYLRAAESHLAQGDTRSAIIALKNALQLEPANARARYQLGKLYLEVRDFLSAEKELDLARKHGHDAPDLPLLQARTWLALGQYQRVIDELPVPEGLKPELVAPLLAMRAHAQLQLGDRAAAEQSLSQADALVPDHPQSLVTRAQLALKTGDHATALAQLERALSADPTQADVWLMKADLLRLTQQTDAAMSAYREALKRVPELAPARIAVIQLHLEANALAPAEAELNQLAKQAPNHPMRHYLGAYLDYQRGRLPDAQIKLQHALKTDPDLLPARLLLGAVELSLGNRQNALTHLDRVLDRYPEHAYARKLKAAALVGTGQVDEAQRLLAGLDSDDLLTAALQGDIALRRGDAATARKQFERAVAIDQDNPQLLMELARARQAGGDTAGAIEALNRAAALDDSGRPEALLVQAHLGAGRHAEAIAAAQRLIDEKPQEPLGYHLRALAQLAKQDKAAARTSLTEALKRAPAYLPAAAQLARLDIEAKDLKAARTRFEGVLAKDPGNSQALIALAGLAGMQGDEKAYLDHLARAKKANPKDPLSYEQLALYWLNRRAPDKALAEARAGLEASGQGRFYEIIGAAQMLQNDRTGTLLSYQKWVKAEPDNARAHYHLALVQRLQGDAGGALRSLERAQVLRPEALDVMAARAVTLAMLGRVDEGLRLARSVQQKRPNLSLGYSAEADILAREQRHAAAGAAYARAAQLSGSSALAASAYRGLVMGGRQREADDFLRQWLKDRPNDAVIHHTLAAGLLQSGNLRQAAEAYEQLLKANPRDAAAANNLAAIYGELKDPRALKQAEAALALAPEQPATLDTLGWILVQQGQPQRARPLLEKAHKLAPNALDIHWHYVVALAQSGDRQRARSELERLLGGGRDFPQREEAMRLQQSLKSGGG